MTKDSTATINNPQRRDSSSKLIFGDNILCSQFLRNYADMEILRHIQPEDIEDVSERYVPLYSTERESDTVKRVNIGKYIPACENENSLELPLYIVSLVEHKTKVEYNVAMQILRYIIYIWEDYEKEMNRKYPHISSRKGFRYQMVGLHDHSNEELLERGDEISLAMLINKIECVEDMEALTSLPDERVEEILRDTPEYLLDIMGKLLRALLYSMNLEEDETENAVSKIKERKMGRLFENVTFDFQEEKRKAREQARREGLEEGREEGRKEGREEGRKEGREEGRKEGRKEGIEEAQKELSITRRIAKMAKQYSAEEIQEDIMQLFGISREQAEEEYRKVFGD